MQQRLNQLRNSLRNAAVHGMTDRVLELLDTIKVEFDGLRYSHRRIPLLEPILKKADPFYGKRTDDIYQSAVELAFLRASDGRQVATLVTLVSLDVDVVRRVGWYALNQAAQNGDLGTVRLMLDAGLDVNAGEGRLFSALEAAALAGKEVVVKFLLGSGAHCTPLALLCAATRGYTELVSLFITYGIDVNGRDSRYGLTTVEAMRRNRKSANHNAILQLLQDAGAKS